MGLPMEDETARGEVIKAKATLRVPGNPQRERVDDPNTFSHTPAAATLHLTSPLALRLDSILI